MRRATAILFICCCVFLESCGRLSPLARPGTHPEPGALQSPEEPSPLRIIALDVGQGDATLIIAPTGERMLIDAGPEGSGRSAILPLFESLGVEELNHIIITHYHDDHYGGLAELLAGHDGRPGTSDDLVPREGVFDRGEPEMPPQSPNYARYESAVAGRRRALHSGQRMWLGGVCVEAVAAGGVLRDGSAVDLGEPPDENAAGIALLAEYAGFRMLIASDLTGGGMVGDPPEATPAVEGPLAAEIGDIDVLRIAHHGSKTSTGEASLAILKPETAIISVGDDNDFFHPHPSVTQRLLDFGIAVYQTERGWLRTEGPIVAEGNVVIEVNNTGSYQVVAEENL